MTTHNRRYLFLLGAVLLLMACALPGWGQPQDAVPTLVVHDPTINAIETALMQPTASPVPPTYTPIPEFPTHTPIPELPTHTVTPTEDALAACLIGTWRATNIQDYVIAAIPADMMEEYRPEYKSSTGQVYVSFFDNGLVTIQAYQLALEFDIQAAIFRVGLTISLDGMSSGQYETDGNQLKTSKMTTTGLSASAKSLGQDVVSSDTIIAALPLVQPPFDQATYFCTDQTLMVVMNAYPDTIPPLAFQRQP
ncbi:MAG: hypothetical protein ACOYYS_03370 [Chloroflexota bacterium]